MNAVQNCVKLINPSSKLTHGVNNPLAIREYVNNKMYEKSVVLPPGKTGEVSENCNGFVHQDPHVTSKVHINHVSFMHTYKVVYLGYAVLDRRYTLPMLPWVIAEIKRHGAQNAEDIYLEVTESCLKAVNNISNKVVFEHKLTAISKFAQTSQDARCFTYMTREVSNGPCAYHVFQADDECTVLELFTMLREMSKELAQQQNMVSPLVSRSNSIASDSIMSSGQHYEVMYLGRIKVSSKRAPPSFIDDAVEKFRVYELEKMRSQQNSGNNDTVSSGSRQRHGSGTSITSLPHSLDAIPQINENQLVSQMKPSAHYSLSKEHLGGDSSSENSHCGSLDEISQERQRSSSSDVFQFPSVSSFNGSTHFLKSPTLSISSTFSHDENLLSPLQPTRSTAMSGSSLIPNTQSLDTSSCADIVEDLQNIHLADILRGRVRSCSGDIPRPSKQTSLPAYRTRVGSGGSSDMRRPRALTGPSSSSSVQQKNRTMLFLIGRLEICLIGMDKKQVLLNKTFNDIAHCSQGVKYLDHYGFICRETTLAGADCYAGYIFRCQTEQVVDEIMQSLKLAFKKAHQDYQQDGPPKSSNVPRVSICEGCPMQWFHRLCSDVDGLQPEKSHCTIVLKLHTLPDCDRELLLQKSNTADVNSLQEQNEVLMMLLRKFCEQKQIKHAHINSGNNHKSDYTFMKEKSASSKLNDFRQKAKKSLSSSFETFRKLKHRDDSGERALTSISDHSISALRQTKSEAIEEVVYREGSYDGPSSPSSDRYSPPRPRSSTFSTTHEVRKASQKRAASKKKENPQSKSPIMNIFMKVGHSDKTPTSSGDEAESASKKGSWRQAIFHRVQTPVQTPKRPVAAGKSKMSGSSDEEEKVHTRKTREQLRALWKKAILEQILLIRMEKENRKLQVSQDAVSHKRMKLDYEDITPCLKDVAQKWDALLSSPDDSPDDFQAHINKHTLLELVKTGVPRSKRGEIWQFLAEQYTIWGPPAHVVADIDVSTPYEDLIGQLTSHQHAILIDLGRTFPSHPFFCQPLGPGQLSLFNLLKAYSLLDKEVGYCQGLSFVAGILLLHIPEERAFAMMKHILFCLGFRRQYKPDMVALQIQMYQLSRLMHDTYREVYDHLEKYDIAPTLYAAPWFLTLFASQFPLGFVSRLFDILFLQGLDTIFKVALVLIGNHKDRILQCHGFEPIMEFLKVTLPSMNPIEMERVFSQVFTLDIHKQLHAYEVEYHVLREEMMFSPSRSDTEIVQKLETANRNLKVQNMELMEQLQVAYSTIDHLQSSETSYKSTIQRLQTRVGSLEDEKEALLHSLGILKKRLQKVETDCLASDANDDSSCAILDSRHPPSFRIVYDLAGTEKEEELQFKSLIRDFCKDQNESPKDFSNEEKRITSLAERKNSSSKSENIDFITDGELAKNEEDLFSDAISNNNNNNSDSSPCLIPYTPKRHLRLSIEEERMKHNL